jgi:hypothetical protein
VLHALALAAALVWAMPQRATAQVTRAVIGADGSYNLPVSAPYAASGVGFAARLGARFGLPSAQETWELGFDYATLGPADAKQPSAGYAAYRGVVGVRLGFDGIIEPGLFLHAGMGHVEGYIAGKGTSTNPTPMVEALTHTAFTWDGGAYLDIKLARFFEIGFQASFDEIEKAANTRALHWFALSAHIQLVM